MNEDKIKIGKILEAINQIAIINKKKITLDNDIELFPSEIHLIIFIHLKQNKNITEISKKLDLTKSAISQTLSRLEKKGLLSKELSSKNKNELQINFTKKGKILVDKLMELKLRISNKITNHFQTLTKHDKEVIQDFIEKFALILKENTPNIKGNKLK